MTDLFYAPWTAAKYLRQVCQHCNTKHELDANNCNKCGAPLQEIYRHPESMELKPFPKTTLCKQSLGYDFNTRTETVLFILSIPGERPRAYKTNRILYETGELYEATRYALRDLAIAFGLPAEFFYMGKWTRDKTDFMGDTWVREPDEALA